METQNKFFIKPLAYQVDAAGTVEATRVSTKVVTTAIKAASDVIASYFTKKQS